MREKRKLLLLSLGTHKLEENGKAGYISTQYTIDGVEYRRNKTDKIGTKTNFVADPIIDYFEPDDIIILGTVKSVWHQFYASAITENNEDLSYMSDRGYLRLLEIEKSNNIYTQRSELMKYGEEISRIYETIDTWEKYSKKYVDIKPTVHILLTRYGVNKDELKENYDTLRLIEELLDDEYDYEVAFDITHSFRSLPIYNLVILNYIKNITKKHITIKHIYYGNIEASHELDYKAPIVDLNDLAYVLDLTNAVAEFKDTGNSVSLIKTIENDEPLKEVLEKFDLAMQLNAFDKIKYELGRLCELIQQPSKTARYTGVREMINTVLEEKFFRESDNLVGQMRIISDADLKFLLANWFFKQNRKGLGLATGLEALRDITTPAFMKMRGFAGADERKYRENAEAYFVFIAKILDSKPEEKRSSMENCVCNLGCKLKEYKEIRNVFAHSLTRLSDSELKGVSDKINQFEEMLHMLKKEYDNNQMEFESLFKIQNDKPKMAKTCDSCRIIIDFAGNCSFGNYRRSSTGKYYDVFYLDEMVRKKLIVGFMGKSYKTTEKAYYLFRYLKKNIPVVYDKVDIILYECTDNEKELIFRAFLENMDFKDFDINVENTVEGRICKCKKIGISIMMESHHTQFHEKDGEYVTTMDKPLKQT